MALGLPWVRLDTNWHHNDKVLLLLEDTPDRHSCGYRDTVTWLAGLAHSAGQASDGYIPRRWLPFIHGRDGEARRLTDVGLWVPAPGGWDAHDFTDLQASTDESAERRRRQQAAALARWDGQRNGQRNGKS